MMIHLLTLFPEFFESPLATGLLGKARLDGSVDIRVHDLRRWTHDRHRTADDYPFGGGPGMVLKPDPFFEAMDSLTEEGLTAQAPIILTTPQGKRFDQACARDLSGQEEIVILCGRYRGVDERVAEALVTHEYSIGDVILNGGETAALIMVEAVVRLLPGVVGDPASAAADSFATGILDHPLYTRPADYRGMSVPEVLLGGHHAEVQTWQRQQALKRTWERRPDLLVEAPLSDADRAYLAALQDEEEKEA